MTVPAPGFPRLVAYFRRHPLVLLLLLTPGIPEYLSGSSPVAGFAEGLGGFVVSLLFLGFNLALYGPGVILVREAHVRWKKGWSTLLLMGTAYGLLEEGTALNTLFDPKAAVVGGLGTYGHAYGVSWVWLLGVLAVHIVLSVGLPIVLLGLALPETRGRSLVSDRGIVGVLAVYVADILLLNVVSNYPAGRPEQFGAALVAGALWFVAWRLPAGLFDPPTVRPRHAPRTFLVYGLLYFPVLLLVPALGNDAHLPALVTGAVDFLFGLGLLLAVRHDIGRVGNESQLTLLALGAILPILLFGLLAQIFLPLVLVLDVIALLFFRELWRHYRPAPTPSVPVGATGS